MQLTNLLLLLVAAGGESHGAPGAADASAPALRIDGWKRLGPEDGLTAKKANAVLPDGDTLWVGTDEGLVALTPRGTRQYGEEEGLPHRVVTALALDSSTGELWIGTMGGLARHSAGRTDAWTQLDSGLANDVIYDVIADRGEVWVPTASGTSRFDARAGAWEIYDHTNARMHEPWCYSAALTDDVIYIAVWGGGVIERPRTGGEWREHRDPDRQMEVDLIRDDGLVHDVVSGISFDAPLLWVSTYFGVSRYDGRRWRSWSTQDSGLVSNFVNVVLARDGRVFFGTDQGLSLFDGTHWASYRGDEDGRGTALLTTEDGAEIESWQTEGALPADHITDVAVQGTDLWVATLGGVVHGALAASAAPDRTGSDEPAKALREEIR